MKTKNLLFSAILLLGFLAKSQYTTGTVNLGSTGMTAKIDVNATTVTLTLTGNSNAMLAIGFGGSSMSNTTDGFIFNSTSNRDYTFSGGYSAPNADATQNWTQTSNTVAGSTRTVVATRSLVGDGSDYVFSNTLGTIPIIFAITTGSTSIAYHTSRGSTTLNKVLGVEDVDAVKSFGIPSLVDSELPILQFEKLKKIDIYDQNGRLIKNDLKPSEKVDISSLQTGIYFLEIQDKSGNFLYHKIMKK